MGRKADGANLILGNWERRESVAGATGLTGGEHSYPSSELLGSGRSTDMSGVTPCLTAWGEPRNALGSSS